MSKAKDLLGSIGTSKPESSEEAKSTHDKLIQSALDAVDKACEVVKAAASRTQVDDAPFQAAIKHLDSAKDALDV